MGILFRGGGGKIAFTMAEILLSLTIIGVVAAITLPSLTGNINERTWNTQRKALYSRLSQAISLMPALNSYGTVIEGNESTSAVDTAAETFVTNGLSKVLKINNICDNEHLADCGITSNLITYQGSKIAFPLDIETLNSNITSGLVSVYNTKAAAFETQNGEHLAVYYNPKCRNLSVTQTNNNNVLNYDINSVVCANFIYDLNGSKGPNTVGKDIGFMSVLYPTDSVVVSATPRKIIGGQINLSQATNQCRTDGSRVSTKEEAMALYYNIDIIGMPHLYGILTTSKWDYSVPMRDIGPGYIYMVNLNNGYLNLIKDEQDTPGYISAVCVN